MLRLLVVSCSLLLLALVAGCGSTSAPATPTGLTATNTTAPIALSWTASSGAASYVVYRGAAAGIINKTLLASGVGATSYTDSAAVGGTTYYYQVTAINSDGQSAPSSDVFEVASFFLKSTTNILSWNSYLNAVNYTVYRSTASDMTGKTTLATGVTALTYTDSTSGLSGTYYYQIDAIDSGSVVLASSNILTVTY